MNKKFMLLPLTLSAMMLIACGGRGNTPTSSGGGLSRPSSEPSTASTPSEEPAAVTQIKDLAAGGSYTVQGKVVAKNTKSIVVHDGTGGVLAFDSSLLTYNIGDLVEVSGGVVSYHDSLQFAYNNDPVVTAKAITGIDPVVPEVATLTPEILSGLTSVANDCSKTVEYTWDTVVGASGTYLTFPVEGSDVLIEAAYLDQTEGSPFENVAYGKAYTVKAYFLGYVSKYTYANVMITSMVEREIVPESVAITGPDEVQATTSATYSAAVTPAAASQAITWSVDDETKATITQEGVLTGVAEGTVTITAASSKEGVVATKTVTITAAPVAPVESIALTAGEGHVTEGATLAIEASVLPNNASKALTWASSDENCLTVNENGVVTALAYGKATVTATAADGSGVSQTIDILVDAPETATVKTVAETQAEIDSCKGDDGTGVTGVLLTRGKVVCSASSYVIIRDAADNYLVVYQKATGLVPGDICEVISTWQWYNSASMYETKKITSVKKGAALNQAGEAISFEEPAAEVVDHAGASDALANVAKKYTINNVQIMKDGNYTALSLDGETKGLSLYGDTAAEDLYKWGTITGYGVGTGKIALLEFTPNADVAPTELTLSAESVNIEAGKTASITVTGAPQYSVTKDALAVSADENIATVAVTVNGNGNAIVTVTGVAAGSTTVTIGHDGCTSKSIPVTVAEPSAEQTLTINMTDLKDSLPAAASASVATFNVGTVEISTVNAKSSSYNGEYYLMMYNALADKTSCPSYLYNSTAIPGKITNITFKTRTGSSGKAVYSCSVGTAAIAANTASDDKVTGAAQTFSKDYSAESAYNYFNISTATANGQITEITVTYSTL